MALVHDVRIILRNTKMGKATNKEIKQASEDGKDMIQFYQAGFLDGFNCEKEKITKWRKLKKKCLKAFEIRFVCKLQGAIKKEMKKQPNGKQRRKTPKNM